MAWSMGGGFNGGAFGGGNNSGRNAGLTVPRESAGRCAGS